MLQSSLRKDDKLFFNCTQIQNAVNFKESKAQGQGDEDSDAVRHELRVPAELKLAC